MPIAPSTTCRLTSFVGPGAVGQAGVVFFIIGPRLLAMEYLG